VSHVLNADRVSVEACSAVLESMVVSGSDLSYSVSMVAVKTVLPICQEC